MFYKSFLPVPFITFVNCKVTEGLLHNLCLYFDIVSAQLGVIPRTRNKFAEIVAVAECYLIVHLGEMAGKAETFS